MDKRIKVKRALAFYTPMVLYFGFIILFLVTRLFLFSKITGNEFLNPQRLPRQYNLIPFATVTSYINPDTHQYAFLDVVGNILLFVPMGVYIRALFRERKIWLSVVFSFFSTCLIETAQFILATGSFDVDDILMNFIGALCGVLIFQLIYRLCKKDGSASKLALSAISITLIPLLVATVFQYMHWASTATLVPVCLVFFTASYLALYFFLYRSEAKSIKSLYSASCVALSLLFFVVVMPMVSP